jgi:signal transduction histidine kinase
LKVFKKKIILIFFLILTVTIKGEVHKTRTSPLSILYIQDSIIKIDNYLDLKKVFDSKDYANGLKSGYILLDKYKRENNTKGAAITSFIIGNILYETNSYKNSINYLKESLFFFEGSELKKIDFGLKLNDSIISENEIYISKNLQKIGSAFHLLKRADEENAAKYIDSTNYYYNKIKNINSSNKEVLKIKAVVFNNIAAIHISNKEYKKAKESFSKAIDIYKKINDKVGEAGSLGNLASIYVINKDYEKAKEIYFEALDLINNRNTASATRSKEAIYENLAWSMYNLRDYKAYEFQAASYNLKDSLRDQQVRRMIETITATTNFDAGKALGIKQQEVILLKQQAKNNKVKQFGIVIIALLIMATGYFRFRQIKLSQKQLIQEKKIEHLKSESQIRILNATLDGKEKERKQIAETLHDSVSALLSSANLHLQASRKQFNGIIPIEIDKTQQIITEASKKIRDLSHTLVSSVLLKFGLTYATKDMAEMYSNSQIKIHTELDDLNRYSQNFEIKIYNIIQELVNNILKHSEAKNATISLQEKKRTLKITISDDGKGFDKNNVKEKDGLGINQIEARIHMLKGKFKIESEEGKGTITKISLPIFELKRKTNLG